MFRSVCFEWLENRLMLTGGNITLAQDAATLLAGCEAGERAIYEEDFESGDGGYVANNVGGSYPGLWHYSIGRRSDGLPNHSPVHSWYYGSFESSLGGGQYPTYPDNQGTLTSPLLPVVIPLTGTTTLYFDYFLETRDRVDRDSAVVSIQYFDDTGVPVTTPVLSRWDGTLPQTGGVWLTAQADLAPFAGREIQLQFAFDTGLAPPVDPEGWYVDNIRILSTTGAADFGDAPSTDYPTTAADNGACHALSPEVYLGTFEDDELDGQPTPNADGDDIHPAGAPDDEDGVAFTTLLVRGAEAEIQVVASVDGVLDVWIDWNQTGGWADSGEHVFDSLPVASGANSLRIEIPPDAELGQTFARFRFNSGEDLSYDGPAADGEVEDYALLIRESGMDFGDAPEPTYPTHLTSNGARHASLAGFFLGFGVDWEVNGQPTAAADGDDENAMYPNGSETPFPDGDEEGVVFATAPARGRNAEIVVQASGDGFLDAWIDFNAANGWTDPGEQILVSHAVTAGANRIEFAVPNDAVLGQTYARFRFSSTGGLSYDGPVADGEVEDYAVEIVEVLCGLEWQNSANRFDVNNDGWVNLTDALVVLDEIQLGDGTRPLPSPPIDPPPPPPYYDVNGDCIIRTDDVVTIFNMLNSGVGIEKATNAADPLNPTPQEDADDAQGPGPVLPAGGTVTWTYLVKPVLRSGNFVGDSPFPLANVHVTDDKIGDVDPVDDDGNGFVDGDGNRNNCLDPGEVWLYRASGLVSSGPYENLGIASADRADTACGMLVEVGGTSEVTDSDPSRYDGAEPLRLTPSAPKQPGPMPMLSEADLQDARDVIVGLFEAAALDGERLVSLKSADLTVADLPGDQLGLAVGTRILIDRDAAGRGWWIDRSLASDPELHSTAIDAVAVDSALGGEGLDLFTVLAHELAHTLGFNDLHHHSDSEDLMFDSLGPGERKLELADLVARLLLADELW